MMILYHTGNKDGQVHDEELQAYMQHQYNVRGIQDIFREIVGHFCMGCTQ